MKLSTSRRLVVLGVAVSASLLLIVGCQTAGTGGATTAGASTAPATWFTKTNASEKGGAQLWSETCSHCHNLRSPSTYGPAQWEVAVYDMRVRAHLTGEEQRKILEFLKAASQ